MSSIQRQQILKHLKNAGSITQREAIVEYSIQSLTKRVSELRREGYNIAGENKRHPMTGQRYKRYSLGSPERVVKNPQPGKLNVGDKVRVTRTHGHHFVRVGAEGVVKEVSGFLSPVVEFDLSDFVDGRKTATPGQKQTQYVQPHELELVEAAQPAVTAYGDGFVMYA